MADYNEMKEKLRRDGMAEQKSKFMSMMGVTEPAANAEDEKILGAYKKTQESMKSYKSGQDAATMKTQAEQLKARAAEMEASRESLAKPSRYDELERMKRIVQEQSKK